MATADPREELNCSNYPDLYTEPVSLKCGHIFDQNYMMTVMDTQETSSSCPECREQHTERPMMENRRLCNKDNFRNTGQEETEVFCTYCDFPVPATKSCLHCEASFCSKHLSNHSKSADHILTDPTTSFDDRKCSIHKEILKYYCTEDSDCICMSCWVAGDHKGHQVELLNEASEKKKEKLRESTELSSDRQELKRRILNLENRRIEEKQKVADVTGKVTELFRDIRRHLDDVENGVLTEVSRQEEKISQSVCDMIQTLETQKELSSKTDLMEEQCTTQDPLTVLQKAPNRDDISPGIGDTIDIIVNAECLTEAIISQMLLCFLIFCLLHLADSLIDLKIRRQFLLDIITANNYIIISEDLGTASYSNTSQNRPKGPERFACKQVLTTNSFTSGRHYWEVDVSGAEKWLIGVAAHSIERKIAGYESYIGYNDKSWGLSQRNTLFTRHNNSGITIDSKPSLKTVGIYLDYDEGRLSFYQLCDPIRHLHTFTTTFTEPLHAAFYVFPNCSIRIIK